MANTVIAVRSSGSTGNTPSLGVIANGELSLNYADGILYYKSSSNTLGQIKTTQVSGLNQQVQFNDSGSFGGNTGLTFDKSTGLLTANSINVVLNSTVTNLATFKGEVLINNATGAGGTDEGGELHFSIPTANTSLSGPIAIDIYQNKMRFFETTGTNRGAYIDLTAASGGAGTNLLTGGSGGGGNVTSVAGATGAVTNNQIITGIQTVSSSYNITFDYVATSNNGYGQNFKVGDDAWIGDINVADTIGIKGQQNSSNAYIAFGPNDGYKLGRASSGPLTYNGALSITNTTVSTTNSTGALVVSGGVGIQGNLYATAVYSNGSLVTDAGSLLTGTLSSSRLPTTGTAGTYGNSTYIPVITTDAYGRVTSVVNTAITGASGNTYNIYNVNTQIFQATANGAQTSFALGFTPYASNNSIVTINGLVEYDWTITGSTLTFNFTPANTSIIRVQSIGINSGNTLASISANLITTGTISGDLTVTGNLQGSILSSNNGIIVASNTVSANYTIQSFTNGLSIGPLNINPSISVTVASGQRWIIL